MDAKDHRTRQSRQIIYFDTLGFGWVADADMMRALDLRNFREELMLDQVLADLLQKNKAVSR